MCRFRRVLSEEELAIPSAGVQLWLIVHLFSHSSCWPAEAKLRQGKRVFVALAAFTEFLK